MFGLFKKKENGICLGSPAKGRAVALQEVNDPTFSEEILGKGMAVIPEVGEFYAPCDGTISLVFDTLHAISMETSDGAEILMHVGLDTVALKGQHFEAYVTTGDQVKKGDLLLKADLEKIKEAGYDVITPMIICNTDNFKQIQARTEMNVSVGEVVLELKK